MIIVGRIIGNASDADIADRLHALSHRDAVEYVDLKNTDIARRRQRVTTDKGTECGIALDRESNLAAGSVLKLEPDFAIVVRVEEESWLRISPGDAASALELGYNAGNLHWRVRFDGGDLLVALDGPKEDYLERLESLLASGNFTVEQD